MSCVGRAEGEDACGAPPRHAHLIGVHGAGMRSLASVLLGSGWKASGSDLTPAPAAIEGITLFPGHAAAHVPPETDLVIYSSAIPPDNPELVRAAKLGIPMLSYFQMLGRLMAGKQGLAVAGTHGKSTTTAMAAEILIAAGHDPTVVFGAMPLGASSGGRAGRGELVLAEACEYRANLLHLRPRHAVILGIEADHFDCFNSLEAVQQAFAEFAALVPADGILLARHDCRATRQVTAHLSCGVETFGLDSHADWSAQGLVSRRGRYRLRILYRNQGIVEVGLQVPGRHNVINALAAAALAHAAGARPAEIAAGLSRFPGLHRRLEVVGTIRGVRLVDDYAHHPTAVAASLDAVRRMFPHRRVWCVFQPHQASRTAHLLDELAASLQNAERVLIAEIFRAREGTPQPGEITAADLSREVQARGAHVSAGHAAEEILAVLENDLAPGDVLVTMGAGDVGRILHGLVERLRKDRAAR